MQKDLTKANALFGHLFFAALAIMAIVYFKERVLFSDPSFFAFNLMYKEGFEIALGRWGSVFTQILPIIAVKLGLPLKLVLQSFSLNFVLCFYAVFLFLGGYFKWQRITLPAAIAVVLCMRLTFFYPTAELYFGSYLSLLVLPIFYKRDWSPKELSWKTYLWVLVLAYVMSYFHQLTLFPLIFVLGLTIDSPKQLLKRLGIFALPVLWFVLRIKVFSESSYESDKLLSLSEAWEALTRLIHNSSYHHYRDIIFPWMRWFIPLWLLAVVLLARQKEYIKALAAFASPVVFWLAVIIILHKGESRIMLDNYYTILGIFIALPFVFVKRNQWPAQLAGLILVGILSLVSFLGIHRAHYLIAARHIQTQNVLDYMTKKDVQRGILYAPSLDYRIYFQDWSLPFESIFQNALNHETISRSVFPSQEPEKHLQATVNDPNTFLGPGFAPTWYRNHEMLHPDYFYMADAPYTRLSTRQETMLQHEDSLWQEISIGLKKKIHVLGTQRDFMLKHRIANVSFHNGTDVELASIPSDNISWRWAYYFLDAEGKRINDIQYANFLLDLPARSDYTQALFIDKQWLENQEPVALRVDVYSPQKGYMGLNMDFPVN